MGGSAEDCEELRGAAFVAVACGSFTDKNGNYIPELWVVVSYIPAESVENYVLAFGIHTDEQEATNRCFLKHLDKFKRYWGDWNLGIIKSVLTITIDEFCEHRNGTFSKSKEYFATVPLP